MAEMITEENGNYVIYRKDGTKDVFGPIPNTNEACCIEYEGLVTHDLSKEEWREYDFEGRVYRINKPKTLSYRKGGSTHRVVDSLGVVHCVPIPGSFGCVLRWKNFDVSKPVNF